MNGSRTNISLKIWAQQEPERDSLWLALGWQPLPVSEKPLFHGVSLRERLNWLLEEARTNKEGGFRPTCGYVFDNHPGREGIIIPFVLMCWGSPALVWFATAIATAHCQIHAIVIPIPPNSIPSFSPHSLFLQIRSLLPHTLPTLTLFQATLASSSSVLSPCTQTVCVSPGKEKICPLSHTASLWDQPTMELGKHFGG